MNDHEDDVSHYPDRPKPTLPRIGVVVRDRKRIVQGEDGGLEADSVFCMLALFLSSSQVQFNRLAPRGYGVGISTSSATAPRTSSFPVTTSAISRVRYSCISSV